MRRSYLLDLSVTLFLAPFGLAASLLIYVALISQTAFDSLTQVFLSVSKNPYLFVVSIALTLAGTAIFVRVHEAPTHGERLRTASSLVIGLGGASAVLAYFAAFLFSWNLGTAGQLMVEGRFFSVYPLVLFFEGLLLRVGGGQALKFKSFLEPLLALLTLPIFFLIVFLSEASLASLLSGILLIVFLFWALERYWK